MLEYAVITIIFLSKWMVTF